MDDRVRGRHSGKRRFVGVYNKLQQLFQFDNVYLLRSGDKIRIPGNRVGLNADGMYSDCLVKRSLIIMNGRNSHGEIGLLLLKSGRFLGSLKNETAVTSLSTQFF